MSNLQYLPFQAMHTWRTHTKSNTPCVLALGLWELFKEAPRCLHVFSQDVIEGERHYCDVQVEVPTFQGTRQVYLMTLISEHFAKEQQTTALEFDRITDTLDLDLSIEEWEDPFSMPTVRWPGLLDETKVLCAVQAWSAKFWPDWEVEFVWGETTDGIPWQEDPIESLTDLRLVGVELCDVLVQCDSQEVVSLTRAAKALGAASVHLAGPCLTTIYALPAQSLEALLMHLPQATFLAFPKV